MIQNQRFHWAEDWVRDDSKQTNSRKAHHIAQIMSVWN